jgi:lipoic acid synthetase
MDGCEIKKVVRMPESLKTEIIKNKEGYRGCESLKTKRLLKELNLNTVCESALCPNRGRCFKDEVATFMILGDRCTRACAFCAVDKRPPAPPDADEIENVAKAVRHLKLKYVVLTSPTRDDLSDCGAGHFRSVIEAINKMCPDTKIEALIPDFKGEPGPLKEVLTPGLTVLAHNLETVGRLYGQVRRGADYKRSLELIGRVKEMSGGIYSKSGIMAGLGETFDEVISLMKDLRAVDCDIFTIGQYIAPSVKSYAVKEYVDNQIFDKYKKAALELGFKAAASAPLVRSSFLAETTFNEARLF